MAAIDDKDHSRHWHLKDVKHVFLVVSSNATLKHHDEYADSGLDDGSI